MRILSILPPGLALHAEQFRSRFEAMPREWEFDILASGDESLNGDRFANAVLHVHPAERRWTRWRMIRRTAGMIWRAIRIARQRRPEVIAVYDPLTLGVMGVFAKLASGAKLVVEINGHIRDAEAARLAGKPVSTVRRTLFNLVGSLTLRMADCVKILNSDQYREWADVLQGKPVVMFHNYVPTDHFSDRGDAGYLLCLGHPFHVKGVDILLKAFAEVRSRHPDIRLKVVGYRRASERAMWDALASGIPGVELLDPVPYDQVQQYLSRCKALVTPSRSEGMGRVFIEAMACGKPCIGSRTGGIPNIVEDGRTGLLAAPEDPEDLARKLDMLLSDPDMRRRMGEAGRERAMSLLSGSSYAENYREMMEMVTNGICEKGIVFNGYEAREAR